jgi:hypothetical protein
MGFRFRKRIRLAPGIHLNLSKTGISTSLGRPGMTVNLRGRKARTTVGIPGSGLSYSVDHAAPRIAPVLVIVACILILLWILG